MKTRRAIVVNKEIYNKPVETESGNNKKISIELYLPPSDIPQSISTELNENEDRLILTFKYFDSEKEKELFESDGVKFIVGRYSGKPLRIEINEIKAEGIVKVKVKLKKIISLIDKAQDGMKGEREVANLKLTEQTLNTNFKEIVQQAAF